MIDLNHEKYMQMALDEAKCAESEDEVPIGAVLVSDTGHILSRSHNRTIGMSDPTGHAEILALREAAKNAMNYRLVNTVLYVTIEPCIMCMGALIHARVAGIVFGASDPKWGACGSLFDLSTDQRLNHTIEVVPGIYEAQCRKVIQDFFISKRQSST